MSHTFQITLYDAAILVMLITGVIFVLQLWFKKDSNYATNRYLSLALLSLVLELASLLSVHLKLWARPPQFLLAFGPLLYFYVKKATQPQSRFRPLNLLHFCLLLGGFWISPWIVLGLVIIYLYLSHRLIQRFYSRLQPVLMDRPRFAFRRLEKALMLITLFCLLSPLNDIFFLAMALVLIAMSAAVILKSDGSSELAQPITDRLDEKEKGRRLKEAIAAGRLYEDAELTLTTLAIKLQIHPHELSRIINSGLKKNFTDLIGELRVREVTRKMKDPAYDRFTLLGIAYASGFNSERTFHRVFKEVTGKTPLEYKNSLRKQLPIDKLATQSPMRSVVLRLEINRITMFQNYLKIAWRNIARNKVYTAINVLGLSIGVCACLIIYLVTSFELSYDTFHPDKDRIYRIVVTTQDAQGSQNDGASGVIPLPMAARNELTGLAAIAGFYNYFPKVAIPGAGNTARKFSAPKEGEEPSPVIVTEPQYFSIFRYQWLEGNPSDALNEPFKVVLSEQEARKYFGAISLENIIGKEVIYDDSLRLTVSGIVKDWNQPTDFAFKDFISWATVQHSFLKKDIDLQNWNMWDSDSQGYVKLAKGVTPAQVERQFPQLVKTHMQLEPGSKVQFRLQPLSDIHFDNHYQDSYSRQADLPTLYGLIAIAAFILLIAAINFINLSTAASLRRSKEIGVRKVLGSSKANLTAQFLLETFIITTLALVIAVAAIVPIISAFHSFIPQGVALHLFNPAVLLFLVGILIVTSLLAGFYPARILSSYLPALSLKGQDTVRVSHKSFLRKTLIVFQFTVSLVFIIGTLVVTGQLRFVLHKNMGFDKDAIITIHTDGDYPIGQLDVFCNKIDELPNVKIVSRHGQTPAADHHGGTFIEYKGAGDAKVDASFDFCDENYVPLFGLKIVAGRNLSHSDTLKEYLINETCAKALGFKNPADAVGKTVDIGMSNSTRQIVGVVKDFNSKSLREAITPFFMGSIKGKERTVSVKLGKNISNFKTTIAQIESAWKAVYPNDQFEYAFFDQTIASFYTKEQQTAQLMNTAMFIAIFISCMGLFGLATFTAQQRVKEIGIRKVLGASVPGIVAMLSKDILTLIMISLLIASPIAYYLMHRWLEGFAYRIAIRPWIFLLAGFAAIAIALATVSFQAIKAALANPVKSLRNE